MKPSALIVALAIGLAGYAAAGIPNPATAVALVVLLAIAGAAILHQVEARRIRRLADTINRQLGNNEPGSVEFRGGPAWRQLAVAVNSLTAAYRRRGAKLERERPWRRELVDSLVQPALLFSADSRMLSANDAARALLGIPIDAEGLTVVQAVGSAALADGVREARSSARPVTLDVEHGDRDLRAVASRVGDEMLLIIADRTRELRVEEVRRNFVVNASHELKTPVTSIQTLAEALQVTLANDPERAGTLANRLSSEAERLARLVRDLLDLRRLEERGPLERAPVDLAELARRTVADQISRAETREVELTVDAPERAMVAGVPGDLEVIVKNLVGNAVQYNRPGGSVDVTIEPRDGQQVIRVRDTGIGIPQQDLVRIFERFYRVDTARSRATGGTGLGLSIVRHAVERHGGSINVESLLGEGTTFTVSLPIEPPH